MTPDVGATDLGIADGTAIRIDGAAGDPSRREYFTVVNGLVLRVGPNRLQEVPPEGAEYSIAVALESATVDLGEAFEFLRGEYDPEIEYFCLGCGTTTDSLERKSCGCPVGCEINDVSWPEIPAV